MQSVRRLLSICILVLGAFAVAVSAINIAGGFRVTDAMLQLFRREGDPEPPLSYFAAPVGLAAIATLGAAATDPTSVLPDVVAGAAATACVAGIGGLASHRGESGLGLEAHARLDRPGRRQSGVDR